jgi:hypothetical protein
LFRLSERFQQIWLDPDFYLIPGSFMQTWLIQKYKIRPEEITEETLAHWMYKFFSDRFGDFETVRLVDPVGLPSLEELGVEGGGTEVQTAAGCIVELEVAPGSTYNEQWNSDHIYRQRTSEQVISLYDGQREVLHLGTGADTLNTDQVRLLTRTAANRISQVGSTGDAVLDNARPRRTSAPNNPLATILISRYVYRDSNGEIHERNLTNSGITISPSELQAEIREIEAPIIAARTAS